MSSNNSTLMPVPQINNQEYEDALNRLNDATAAEQWAEYELFQTKVSNVNALFDLKVKIAKKTREHELELERKAQEDLLLIQKQAQEDFLKIKDKLVEDEIKKAEEKSKKKLTAEEKKAIADKFKYEGVVKERYEKRARERKEKEDKKAREKAGKEYLADQQQLLLGKGQSWEDRKDALKELTHSIDASGRSKFDAKKTFVAMTKVLANLSQQLDKKVDEIAMNKAAIDTRLQGSVVNTAFNSGIGSQWHHLSKQIVGLAGMSPLYRQESIVNNLKTLVGQGISYNVTQRAFLQTISEKIATTFNAANGTLLRLVRIQQQDTTAGRLGMESALNSFLNRMYETTEYMSDIMNSVKGSLEESMALMGGADAVAFEYQVQKWMGSLYSVGMSQNAIQGISSALGKLAAGDIEGLMGSGTGNLLVMAANKAGLSLTDILARGLDESSTNQLLQSMVNYLSGIYSSATDSRLVQQQMANVFGVTASDLKAAANLATSSSTMSSITGNKLNYAESIDQLMSMANSMYLRTSLGEMMTNVWENLQYTTAAGIANSPILYFLNKTAGLLEDAVGGISIPAISVMGNMVDLHTTVADLMRVGAMSGSILSGMGQMIASLSGGGIIPSSALKSLGISSNLSTVSRGTVSNNRASRGASTSESGITTMVGNTSSGDVQSATLSSAAEQKESQMAEAKESGDNAVTTDVIDEHIVDIYTLLQKVVDGESSLNVKVAMDVNSAWN